MVILANQVEFTVLCGSERWGYLEWRAVFRGMVCV